MLHFFDYVYYIIWKFYNKYERNAGIRAVTVLAGLQLFNIMTVSILYSDYRHTKSPLNKVGILLIYAILIIFEFIRYNRKDFNYKVFDEWWGKGNGGKKHPKLIWAQLYILLTAVILCLTIFYTALAHTK